MTTPAQRATPTAASGEQVPPAAGSAAPGPTPDWWDERYRNGDVPWDTGIVPPEVVRLVAALPATGGWAFDLGCGTGLTTRYLAAHGFKAVGVDLAQSALAAAARLAAEAPGVARFCLGDVTDLGFLAVRAALAIDVGCFHAVEPLRRPAYVESLAGHLLSGSLFLLYTHDPNHGRGADESAAGDGPRGATPRDIGGFAPWFDLLWTEYGEDRGRIAAWRLMRRR
jgi:SAM-dependent methyltransferase